LDDFKGELVGPSGSILGSDWDLKQRGEGFGVVGSETPGKNKVVGRLRIRSVSRRSSYVKNNGGNFGALMRQWGGKRGAENEGVA